MVVGYGALSSLPTSGEASTTFGKTNSLPFAFLLLLKIIAMSRPHNYLFLSIIFFNSRTLQSHFGNVVRALTVAGLLVTLLFVPGNIYSQSKIHGVVRDESGKPVSHATVAVVQASDSIELATTITNDTGYFVIPNIPMGEYLIRTSSVGFAVKLSPAYSIISSQDDINIGIVTLLQENQELNQVVVSVKKPLIEQKIDRTIINVKSSITSSGTTALDILERSPGVAVNRQSNIISMAGKEGVVIMINGKINYMPVTAAIQMLAGMNAATIERIELITTPPANYDAEGNAGFINIVTLGKPDMGMNGSISITGGYGKGERAAAAGNFNYRNAKLNIYGDYSYSLDRTEQLFEFFRKINHQGTVRENFTRTERETEQRNHLARLGVEYQLTPKTSIATLVGMYNNRWSMDAVNENKTFIDASPDSSILIINDEINRWKHYMGNINVVHQFTGEERLSLNVDYLYYHDYNPVNYVSSFFDKEGGLLFDEKSRSGKLTPINIWVGSLDYSKRLGKKLRFDAGIKGTASEFRNDVQIEKLVQDTWISDPTLTAKYILNEDIAAVFTSFTITCNDKTEIKSGMRYEYTISELGTEQKQKIVDRKYGNLFPSIFIAHKVNKNHSIGMSYSRRITRPTFNEMAPFVIFLDPTTFFSGNPALKPAIGDVVKGDYTFKRYSISLSYTRTKDAIARFQTRIDPATNRQVFASENLDNTKVLSATLSVPVTISEWWSMQNNVLGVLQEVNGFDDNKNFRIRQSSIRLNSSQSFNFLQNYSGEISGFYQSATMFGTARLKPTGMLNIGMQRKIGRGKIRVGVDDVFNTFELSMVERKPNANFAATTSYKLTQRVYKLTYTRSFGNEKVKERRNRTTASEEERGRVN